LATIKNIGLEHGSQPFNGKKAVSGVAREKITESAIPL